MEPDIVSDKDLDEMLGKDDEKLVIGEAIDPMGKQNYQPTEDEEDEPFEEFHETIPLEILKKEQ